MASFNTFWLIFGSMLISGLVNADIIAQSNSTVSPIRASPATPAISSIDRSPDAPIKSTVPPIESTASAFADKVKTPSRPQPNDDASNANAEPSSDSKDLSSNKSSPAGNLALNNDIVSNLLSSLIPGAGGAGKNGIGSLGFLSKLSTPLAHLIASNGQPSVEDIDQLLKAVPEIAGLLGMAEVVSGGAGGNKLLDNIDLTKLPPSLVNYVANGGQIPGVSQADMQKLTQRYLTQLASNTTSVLPSSNGSTTNFSSFTARQVDDLISGAVPLPPISSLPSEYVQTVLKGGALPGLTMEQTEKLKQLYMEQMFGGGGVGGSLFGAPAGSAPLIGNLLANISNSQSISMTKSDSMENVISELKNFDLSKVPQDVIRSVMSGQPLDFNKIPEDLLHSLINKSPKMFGNIVDAELQRRIDGSGNHSISIDGKRSVSSDRSIGWQPYDVNSLDQKADISKYQQDNYDRINLWTAVGLGVVGVATIVLVLFLCWRYQRKRKTVSRATQNNTIPFYNA